MSQNLTFNLDVETGSAVSSINQFFSAFDQGAAKAKGTLNSAFGQTLQTEVEINLKNGELVAKKIQSATQESKRLADAANAINGKWGKTPKTLKAQVTTLKEIRDNTQKYSDKTGEVSEDWKLITQRIREASKELNRMQNGGPLQQMKQGLTGIIGKFTLVQTLANLATGAIQGFASKGAEFIGMAGRMEVLQLQLEAFTGGSEEAAKAFDDFAEIAAKTPFDLEQVANAGKIMMAFGMDADEAVEATDRLSIAAAATGGDINNLGRNLGQIAAQGQAYTRDLTQFAMQGIPIWDEMSKVTGKSVVELKKMASEGQISFDIVSKALENLTGKGSKFAQIADKMQSTFQGRLANIGSAFNKLALAMVNSFNDFDSALGGIVSGSMKLFADGISALAKHMDTIAKLFAAATTAAGYFFVVSNWSQIVNLAKGFGTILKLLTDRQLLLNAAATVYAALTGNWVGIAAAVALGGAAYIGMSIAQNRANQSEQNLQGSIRNTTGELDKLTDAQQRRAVASGQVTMDQMAAYNDLIGKMKEKKGQLDKEIQRLDDLKEKLIEAYEVEREQIQASMDKQKEKIDQMKDEHSDAMSRLNERHSAALEAIDAEIGKLREKTEAEKDLEEFQKKEIIRKIKSGELEGKALLQARARLSRMERQDEIAVKLIERAKLQKEQETKVDALKKSQKEKMDRMIDKYDELKGELDNLKEEEKKRITEIENAKNATADTKQTVEELTGKVDAQITVVNNLAGEYANMKTQATLFANQVERALEAQNKLNRAIASQPAPPAPAPSNRFAGGPVSGGSSYTVNELGKEAFLSASGRLSMINAPAWGEWRAPSSGTIIPAHLTRQLDVPTGGININKQTGSSAVATGGMDMGRLVRSITGAMGGDSITNNVTIQSANTTQTASDVMVQLAKLKRLRYN